MGRAPCCDKANVKKGPWSPEEDVSLKNFIEKNGTGGNWIALPQKIGLKRCGKSCRLRWLNYLRPNLKHGCFSEEEDRIISSLYISIGSRWSIIAAQLPGRTDNDIKNYWNTKLKKKLFGSKSHKDQNQRAKRGQNVRDQHILDTSVKYGGINNAIKPHTYCSEPSHPLMHPLINQVQRQALDENASIRRLLMKLGEKLPSNDDAHLYQASSSGSSMIQNQLQISSRHEFYQEEFDEMFNCNSVKLEGSFDNNCYHEGIRPTTTTTSNNSNWSEVSPFDNYQIPMSMENFQGMQQGFF